MDKYGILEWILLFFIGIGFSIILTFPVMWLWNYLMPMIFGLPKLTFWQTFGLQILVGCFIPYHGSSSSKN